MPEAGLEGSLGGITLVLDSGGSEAIQTVIDTSTIDLILTGTQLSAAVVANSIGPTQVDETTAYTWTGLHTFGSTAGLNVRMRNASNSVQINFGQYELEGIDYPIIEPLAEDGSITMLQRGGLFLLGDPAITNPQLFFVDNAETLFSSITQGATGNLVFNPSSGISEFNSGATFSLDVTVPDEVYGAGWNGSLEVPTKNAIWDAGFINSTTGNWTGTFDGQEGTYYLARANHTGTQTASTISDFDTQVRTSRLDQMAVPSASISLNSQLITNLASPVSANDAASKSYVDTAVTGLLDYRGSYDASTNLFPSTGGSGLLGAVLKGDFWICSVAGTLGGESVTAGDLIIAIVDTPGQTASNWDLIEHNIGTYVSSVTGTANRVTSTGGTTPQIDISATFEALLGKVASPLSQFAATTSAQLRTVLSDETGTGAAYFQGGDIGTPSAGTLTNCTGLPVSTGVSGLGANVATFLATPSSANLAAALTDEVGTAGFVPFYSTGTWTPTLIGSTTPGAQTYTNQSGAYVRIGNRIFCEGRVAISAKDAGIAGNVQVGGLPFPLNGTVATGATIAMALGFTLAAAGYWMYAQVGTGGVSTMNIRQSNGNADAAITVANMAATSELRFQFDYTT
jgi:hypothetical protein